jgi:hypothetical protein
MSVSTTEDREATWLDLLGRLTEDCAGCAADGNFDEGFRGEGDIDMIAPVGSWPLIEQEFRQWATRHAIEPVIVCRHRTGVLMLVALGDKLTTFFELEVRGLRYFRGMLLFQAEDLLPMMERDSRGFRKLRRGAGAMIRLLPSGTRWDGSLKWKGPRIDTVARWLQEDRAGVVQAAELYGSARGAALAAAESVMAGEWNRRAMVTVGVWAAGRSFMRPDILLKRSVSRLSGERECTLLDTLRKNSRRVPDDPEVWLESVRKDHDVYGELRAARRP